MNCDRKNFREEPKGIVFLSKLLILFQICHWCFASNPALSISQSGTMLTIRSTCSHCQKVFTWTSQPLMLGKFPAGNLLLSFSILCSGASINKILLVFRHMGVLVYHYPTYFYHQRHLLVPTIVKYWRGYQADLLAKLAGKEVVIAGDGRHDSMGHSAKYGTYTIFCCTIGYIIHIVLVQVSKKLYLTQPGKPPEILKCLLVISFFHRALICSFCTLVMLSAMLSTTAIRCISY